MIVNDKFVEPKTYKAQPPLKKDKNYYNVYGNIWNHPYLSSPKVSQFYLDSVSPTSKPNNPTQPLTLSSRNRYLSHKHAKLIAISPAPSKPQNESISKLSNNSNTPTSVVNDWQRIDLLPTSKLKVVLTRKIMQNDMKGLENIHTKSQEIRKLENWKEKKITEFRNELRKNIKKRHENVEKLEKAAGIHKTRSVSNREKEKIEMNKFGYGNVYKASEKIQNLSKPKSKKNIGEEHSHIDFRGIIHVDYPGAVGKLGLR